VDREHLERRQLKCRLEDELKAGDAPAGKSIMDIEAAAPTATELLEPHLSRSP
jgi:hypothetical protein